MNEKTNTSVLLTSRLYLPCAFVEVPCEVPFTMTLTPGSGASSSNATTLPETVNNSCALVALAQPSRRIQLSTNRCIEWGYYDRKNNPAAGLPGGHRDSASVGEKGSKDRTWKTDDVGKLAGLRQVRHGKGTTTDRSTSR